MTAVRVPSISYLRFQRSGLPRRTGGDLAEALDLVLREVERGRRKDRRRLLHGAYTTMWTGVHDCDGPENFRLVLLDNGCTDTLADEVGRQALRCIRCSACLNVCPVYERPGGHAYPGPIGAILTPQLRGTTTEIDAFLPYASSLCGACYEVCPVAIDIPEVLLHLRAWVAEEAKAHSEHRAERATMKAATYAMTQSGRVPRTETRALPELPEQTFRQWWME